MKDRHYEVACPALAKAQRMDPRPSTLYRLAQCEDEAGRIATAAALYDDYLVQFDRLSRQEQSEEHEREAAAAGRRQALDSEVPRITLRLGGDAPDGTRVTRLPKGGGTPVDVRVNMPLPIDPGEYVVVVEAPNRPRWDKRFFVFKGDRKVVDLTVPPPGSVSGLRVQPLASSENSHLPSLEQGTPGRRVAAYVIGGVGAAALVTGLVTGAIVWGSKGTISSNCPWVVEQGASQATNANTCNQTGYSATNLASTSSLVSTITLPAGGVAIIVSAILLLTEPAPPKIGAAGLGTNTARAWAIPRPTANGLGWVW